MRVGSGIVDDFFLPNTSNLAPGTPVAAVAVDLQSEKRDQLREQLAEAGIETGLHYPTPLHLQQAYKSLGYKQGDFPVTETLKDRILSLPMYAELEPEMIDHIVASIREFYRA